MVHHSREHLAREASKQLAVVEARRDALKPRDRISIPPQPMPAQHPRERRRNVEEVALGYTPEQARLEAMSIVTMSPLARLQQIEQLRRSEDRQAANRRLDELHREAVDRTLLLALHSPHGVRERMTWFWSNHFSVAAAKSNLRALVGDHEQALRERALGRFEDLLQAATFQPSSFDIRPATGSGKTADTSPFAADTPPLFLMTRFIACKRSASLLPVAIILWLS